VERALAGQPQSSFQILSTVVVPARIYEWKASPVTRGQALEVQDRNRPALQSAFAAGHSVLGYERDSVGNGKFLLGKWEEAWLY